jgi:hypothetical protein
MYWDVSPPDKERYMERCNKLREGLEHIDVMPPFNADGLERVKARLRSEYRLDPGSRERMMADIQILIATVEQSRCAARIALQQFEFQYGKRKRGWDAAYVMDQLREVVSQPPSVISLAVGE